MLLPAVRRLWRDSRRLQVGTDPARAVVLELADPLHARLLDLLDGTHTERSLLRAAQHAGMPPEDVLALLGALSAAGYVVDANALLLSRAAEATRRRLSAEATALALRGPESSTQWPSLVLRRRLRSQVLVTGSSRLAVPIASILAASGVGHVHADQSGVTRMADTLPGGLLPEDVHRPRGVAAADALRRAAPELDVSRPERGLETFVVLVGPVGPASLTAFAFGRRRLPHLAISVRDGVVVVGPLVRPGHTPCLNCLDLHRQGLDPDWPAVAAQLSTLPESSDPVTATTALSAAAFAAHEVLTHLDGGVASTVGATVEISEPGRHARRQWDQHPSCGCRRRQSVRR
jgi:bacteriocin biosynthesis cyclodehydratase domain-containing protein